MVIACAAALAASLLFHAAQAAEGKLSVVAAESLYGDIARQIGGERVDVISILNNPEQDPHAFETSPATVRQVADARIVIFNGVGYDPWIEKLLKAAPRPARIAISAAQIMGRKPGENPHLWYDPVTMPAMAKAIADALSKADPKHAGDYAAGLQTTLKGLAAIEARVAELKAKHAGKPVTATEPVFGPMTTALGLVMRNERFQIAMMNESEPSARDVAAFQTDLKERKVRALIYNPQVSAKLTNRMRALAEKAAVPVVGVTETLPAGLSFQEWVLGSLDGLDKALSTAP